MKFGSERGLKTTWIYILTQKIEVLVVQGQGRLEDRKLVGTPQYKTADEG